jgi:hypothetical protein
MAFVVLGFLVLPACGGSDSPTAPSANDLTGRWTGTSTYPNAPFQVQLTQTGVTLRGQYADGLDRSIAVTGTFSDAQVHVVIDFGDAKLNLDGSIIDARTVQGTMYTSALGNKLFPFTMTR